MTFPLIKATHYIGLAALMGGPAFWYLIWRPARRAIDEESVLYSDQIFALTVRFVMLLGLLLSLFSGVLDLMRATEDLYAILEWEYFTYFTTTTQMGHIMLARFGCLALVFIAGWRLPTSRRSFGWIAPLAAGLAVIGSVSILSHQAAKDSPFPLIFDMIHLLATVVWGGGLVYFSVVPWRVMKEEPTGPRRLAAVANMFSTLGLLGVVVLTVTGIYISVQQFHSVVALTGTTYGMYLIRKVTIFLSIIGIAGVHHLYFVPRLEGESEERTGKTAQRFLALVRIETLLLVGVLVAAGFLTTQMPPERPVGLIDIPNQSGTFEGNRYHLSVVPREQGQLLFELLVQDASGRPVELERAQLDLTMLEHYMPPYILRLDPAEPGVYRATAILSMGGRWHVTLDIDWPGGRSQQEGIEFDTRASLRDAQAEKRYAWAAVMQKRFGLVWLFAFVILTAAGGYALIRGLRAPRSVLLTTLGVLLFLGGAFQMVRVAEVPGPYSYRRNPVRRTAEVVARGADLYQANCLICHGIEGRGDGPAAYSLNPRPANFTTPPDFDGTGIRGHGDGELYWAITHGMRGSSMPAFERLLTDEERWTLVHYIRVLSGERF